MAQLSQNYIITMSTLNSLLIKNPQNIYDWKSNARIIEQQLILAQTNDDSEKVKILKENLELINNSIKNFNN